MCLEHPDEIWKDVRGFEGYYQVSNKGRVKSLERKIVSSTGVKATNKERILSPSVNPKGYMIIRFSVDGKFPAFAVHRLVAEAFLEDFSSKLQVNHINGVKTDNKLENLECVDQLGNMNHRATIINKKPRGVRKHNNKWKAQGTFRGVPINFGYYKTKEEAYKAFFEGFKKLRGCEPWDLNTYKTH